MIQLWPTFSKSDNLKTDELLRLLGGINLVRRKPFPYLESLLRYCALF